MVSRITVCRAFNKSSVSRCIPSTSVPATVIGGPVDNGAPSTAVITARYWHYSREPRAPSSRSRSRHSFTFAAASVRRRPTTDSRVRPNVRWPSHRVRLIAGAGNRPAGFTSTRRFHHDPSVSRRPAGLARTRSWSRADDNTPRRTPSPLGARAAHANCAPTSRIRARRVPSFLPHRPPVDSRPAPEPEPVRHLSAERRRPPRRRRRGKPSRKSHGFAPTTTVRRTRVENVQRKLVVRLQKVTRSLAFIARPLVAVAPPSLFATFAFDPV